MSTFFTRILIAFVLISIGFSLGKNASKGSLKPVAVERNKGHQLIVYYFHASFRCVTCNTIEQMAANLLEKKYAKALLEDSITWRKVNFQENTKLAQQLGVVSSCVVVASYKDGKVLSYKRLDEVWHLIDKQKAFDALLSLTIDTYLKKKGEV